MKIGIDLDGVVFNSEMYFMTMGEIYDSMILNKNSLIQPEEPRVQKKYSWTKEELDGYIKNYSCSTDFDIMPGAKIVIDEINKKNETFVISARGQFEKKEIEIAMDKLKDAQIDFKNFIFGKLDKTATILSNNIEIIIDDRYDVCLELAKHKVFCIYFRMAGRKKIRETKYIKEVNNWGEICRLFKDRGII